MANNTVEILTSINKAVSAIASSMALKNGDGKTTTAKLSRGDIASDPNVGVKNTLNLSSVSMKDFIKVIGGLPASVKIIAGLSGRTINNFKNVMDSIAKILINLNKTGKEIKIDNIKNAINPISSIVKIKALSSMIVFAPLADKGIKLTYIAIGSYIRLLKYIESSRIGKKYSTSVNNLIAPIKPITKLIKESIILLGACAGLGVIIAAGGGKIILSGIATLGATFISLIGIIGVVGLASKFLKATRAIKGVNEIIKLTFASFGLIAACVALGSLISNGDTKNILLGGLAVLGGTFMVLVGIIGVIGWTSKFLKATRAIKGVKEIITITVASMGVVAACVALGSLISKGDTMNILLSGLAVLGGTFVAILFIIGTIALVSKFLKATRAMNGVKEIIIVTLAAMGVVVAAKYLADFTYENWKDISVGLLWTGGVLIALGGLAFLAGKFLEKAKTGLVALGSMELLAFGAMGVVFCASKLAKELKGRYIETSKALGYTAIVLVGIGALAAIAGKAAPFLYAGSLGLGAAELVAFGAMGVVLGVIKLNDQIKKANTTWNNVMKSVGHIAKIIGAFGLTAAAFSLLTGPIMFATPAIALTVSFVNKVTDTIKNVIELSKEMDKSGGTAKLSKMLNTDVPSILKAFKLDNFNIPLNKWDIAKLYIKFAAISELTEKFLSAASTISKIANVGSMTEDGLLKPVISVDKENGTMIYGEPVDIKKVSTVICESLTIFANSMKYGFEDVNKVINGSRIFNVIGSITTPISSFIEMISGYVGGKNSNNEYTLTPVRIDEKGQIQYGAPVNVKETSASIANAITSFVSVLYSNENASKWSQYVYGDRTKWQKFWGMKNRKSKSIKEIGGVLGLFVSPVVEFIECISKFQAKDKDHLSLITVDSEGNVKTGGEIDVKAIATLIGGGITTFVTEVFKTSTEENVKKNSKTTEEIISRIGSVSNAFAELSTNKRIDTEKLNSLYANFNKGAESIKHVTSSISSFDSIVEKEKEKRKKNIEELSESIETLLSKFKDVNGIESLCNLINALQNMNTSQISSNINAIKDANGININGGRQEYSGNNYVPYGRQNVNPGLTQEEITSAIHNALSNTEWAITSSSTMSVDANNFAAALIDCMKNLIIKNRN